MGKASASVFVLLALLVSAVFASTASASEAEEIAAVPVIDALNRTENPLSNSGQWTALNWAGGTVKTGQDTTSGWGSVDTFSTVNGAYWNSQSTDAGGGDAAGLTTNVSPGSENRYVSVWLNMPNPGSAKSGYQLRWTLNSGLSTYTVKLLKWVGGSETVLASNASVSIPSGTRMMLADNGDTVSAWMGTSTLTQLLSASDSTYTAGYGGIEASGNASRSKDWRIKSYSKAKIAALPLLDDLQRGEGSVSFGGRWTKTAAAENVGTAYASGGRLGYGAASTAFSSAYWNPETFTDTGPGVGVAATVTANSSTSGHWMALNLDGSNLGNVSTQNKYEVRWTATATVNSYTLELAKVINNTRTVLTSKTQTIEPGQTIALTEKQGSLLVWVGNPPAPVLIATDTSLNSGYAGISASGATLNAKNFQAGPLTEQMARVYWGARLGGSVYEEEEKKEGKEPKSWGDAPWDGETWNRFESHAGGKHISVMHFGQPAPWTQAFAESPLKLSRERGALPLITMDSTGATLKEIAEGKKDTSLNAWAEKAAAYKYPFFLRWDWEPNLTWSTWGTEAAASPTTYKEAWWHFHDLVEAKGASNVTWVWCPSASTGTSLSSLYPGKESESKGKYVDWTCLDGYNKEPWKSFETIFRSAYNELISLAPTKPTMIGEVASSEPGGSKSSWIADAYSTQIPQNFANVKAVVWYNKLGGGEWPIESSTAAKTAFASAIASPFYAENIFGSPATLTKIKPLPWDYTPPSAPTVSSVSPASPANNNSPKVIGSAEVNSTVKLYSNSTCTSSVLASGTAAEFSSPGISVSVSDNTTTTFYATATDAASNTSACSASSVNYTEDSSPPTAPTVSSVSPASGSNNNEPKVIGSAESGSTVKLYGNSSCTGSVLASGTAATFASPGIVATVADNTTTTFYATATDAAGNASACSTTSVKYEEGTPKIYWGSWLGGNAYTTSEKTYTDGPWDQNTWNLFEEHTGKKISLEHFGQPAPWNQSFAEEPLRLTRERGALPVMDMDADGFSQKEIVEGKKDSYFKTWATAVKNYGYPMFFRWEWEMNGTWFQYGKEVSTNPTLYKEVWWHLHKLFEEQGASNITWVWCPNISFSGSTSLSSLYPGDEYVDWTCLDGYNFGTNPQKPDSWKSFSTLYKTSYEELLSLAPSKPIMIGEMGSTEIGGEKAPWITDAIGTQIPKNFPKIKAVLWYNKWDGELDWPIETSTSAQTAFKNAIAAPIYAANTFGSPTKLTKIEPLP